MGNGTSAVPAPFQIAPLNNTIKQEYRMKDDDKEILLLIAKHHSISVPSADYNHQGKVTICLSLCL